MAKSAKNKIATEKEVVLSGDLTLRFAGSVRNQILQALDKAEIVHILFQDVEDVDLSFIQIICASHRSVIEKNKSLVLQDNLPAVLTQLVDESGLKGQIGCSLDIKGACLWR
jgi:ABC-type transporter Mla MlaB component